MPGDREGVVKDGLYPAQALGAVGQLGKRLLEFG